MSLQRKNRGRRRPPDQTAPSAQRVRRDPRQTERDPVQPVTTRQDLGGVFQAAASEMWSLEQIQAFVTRKVDTVLRSRHVPPADIQPPRLDIAIPALEAMRFNPLRNQFAALIAASMDTRVAHTIHPCFIDILRQITEDELALMMGLPEPGEVIASGHLHRTLPGGRTQVIYRNILPPILAERCRTKRSIPTYVDNLLRLELISVPGGVRIKEDAPYAELMTNSFCKAVLNQAPNRRAIRLERSLLAITDLGKQFRDAALRIHP